jgi:hypothetical protein
MSIKDVSSMASLRAMPATRQETIHAMTGKNVDPVDSFEVSLSPEAMAQARIIQRRRLRRRGRERP